MGIIIKFLSSSRKLFMNQKGKLQILPKPDLSLGLLIILIFCWFYFELNDIQQMLVASLFVGAVVTWSLRHIILQETPFISYFAWVILFIAFGLSVYLIVQFAPIFF